ncbi:MAG: CDP-diacylglycerol--glycerol-3-phosphate 3-phosphatidyltransferase [Ruminococcus sp.]|nr:CDP-diacylglycerol--glycerol-3-phosphate 3-phosphatidyltransferase [Ruminococcus sp.]MBQ1617852.1 CDP-diacylglycerol--glycerol-3-phosphate 3-phosphatidyltransferase [Ruminococcus sp.]MBQ2470053.1 CDP-diacylglycerol--glycerol-3-phosphate 3-phosphatidyltransferase [Ruminococcus sp.]MBQ4262430.1 CDP-diacylglycerol--glycerol-3-phosphate 3-phosphatidyltransferase [Ruminococcus sp.]
MNLPNKLTLWRIILVPFFVAALLIPFPLHTIVALVLFIAASITDMLDGRIARKRNLITDFGKFADPLADKILVLAALLCFVQNGWCDCIAVIIVLFREFTVTSIRLIAAAKGEVIAANIWGKVKTVTQMVAIITILVFRAAYDIIVPLLPQLPDSITAGINQWLFLGGETLIWISTVFAIISGVIYVKQNYHFISEK